MKKDQLLKQYRENLSVNLKYLLDIYSMNIFELSNKIDMSYSAVYRLVRGAPNPNLETMLKISQEFDLNISQLIGELPILKDTNINFIKSVPLLLWEEVVSFLKDNNTFKNDNASILLSHHAGISEKCFSLRLNIKTEPLFQSGTILIFDTLSKQIREYDDKYVLVSSGGAVPIMKKLYIEGSRVFLQSIDNTIPSRELQTGDSILAYLLQTRKDF
jgi:transcriptional regulator with XRE-family HTH domain